MRRVARHKLGVALQAQGNRPAGAQGPDCAHTYRTMPTAQRPFLVGVTSVTSRRPMPLADIMSPAFTSALPLAARQFTLPPQSHTHFQLCAQIDKEA